MRANISIIVPVYQAEAYIEACIQSILNQTFTDFELILVDDGSSDHSGVICDDYAAKDARIKVLHQENMGISVARNAGLDMATGDYIGFVDSDDTIDEHMYNIMYHQIVSTASDIIMTDFYIVNEQGEVINQANIKCKQPEAITYTGIEALQQLFVPEKDADFGTGLNPKWILVWNKLFKRHLFEQIQFADGILYQGYQDEKITHHLLYASRKITHIRQPLYYYVERKHSLSNFKFDIRKFERVYALRQRAYFFKEKQLSDLHYKALNNYMDTFFWTYYIADVTLTGISQELKQLKQSFAKSVLDFLANPLISWKQKLFICCFIIFPPVLALSMHPVFRRQNQ